MESVQEQYQPEFERLFNTCGMQVTLSSLLVYLEKYEGFKDDYLSILRRDVQQAYDNWLKRNAVRCIVGQLRVEPHPTNPNYQFVHMFQHKVVTGNHYEDGVLAVFIPEGCTVPEKLLREMWLWNEKQRKGTLCGKHGNKVRSKMIAGFPSPGLIYGRDWKDNGVWKKGLEWNENWKIGDDVSADLGIVCPGEA